MRRQRWSWLAGLLAAGALAAEPVQVTERVDLFNGRDFTGWKLFLPGDADVTQTWRIEDGLIRCTGKPAGYLRTETAYTNYKLTVEWRWPANPGNSGVLIHQSGPDTIWPKSLECQLAHRNAGDFWVIGGTEFKEHRGIEGRRVPKTGPLNEKELGEWNTYTIVARGDTVTLWVNGELMNKATECSETGGRICLQSEGAPIDFRTVRLEPLPANGQ